LRISNRKKGQAAFEYLVTYGWAILAALIAIGALSYFGFVSPSNLLPNKCSFGRQMECTDYQITDEGTVKLMFRNNFGKPIQINDINMVEDDSGITGNHPFNSAVGIASGATEEVVLYLDPQYYKGFGDKQSLNLVVNFSRSDISNSPSHIVTGYIFVTVSPE
jgi:hypothetical protein